MRDYLAFPPVRAIRGSVRVPPSKSATNRALILAALENEPVELLRPLDSDDTRALARCLESMGGAIILSERGWTVRGPLGTDRAQEVLLDAASSGTAARFLAALAAAVPGRYRLTGSPRLQERPMSDLVTALRTAGASVRTSGREGFLPVEIEGGTLRAATIPVEAGRSSQFVSALLLAAVAVEGGLSVRPRGPIVSAPYVDTTLDVLEAFGHRIRRDDDGTIAVERGGERTRSYPVPGDWSSAVPFFAAAGIAGGEVQVTGLVYPSHDADARAVDVIETMGVGIERRPDSVSARRESRALRPVSVSARDFPDAVPALAALALHAEGESRFRDVAHLRDKESDRLGALAVLLQAAGGEAEAGEDGIIVTGPRRRVATGSPRLPTFEDHRMAMTAALLSLDSGGTLIENPGCVAKSYPSFFEDLETILVRG